MIRHSAPSLAWGGRIVSSDGQRASSAPGWSHSAPARRPGAAEYVEQRPGMDAAGALEP
jgi:hypothetical protein